MKHYNFQAYMFRTTTAIRNNLNTDKRLFVLKRACELLNHFDKYSQHLAITQWCKEFRLSEKALKAYKDGNEKAELTNTELLREFLGTFNIRENEISGQLDIERNGVKYTYDELTIMVEDEGLRTYNLKKFMKSSNKNITVVNVVNPLNTMFKELANNYIGVPVIHELASCIKAYDFGDKEPGYYQRRLGYYLHKWLCKAAGQALHIANNDAMFLFLDPFGGTGKTELINWLFSLPEMVQYYLKISDNDSYMPLKLISRSKFALNFDELPFGAKRYVGFKSNISGDSGEDYNKTTGTYERYNRQVNFIGSSNKCNRDNQSGFILDEDAGFMRRVIPVEIEGQINYRKYLDTIDLRQLWGQAAKNILSAHETGNKKLLTWECDWNELRTQNKRYVNRSNEDPKIILQMFPCGNKENGTLMQPLQLIQLIKEKGIRIYFNEMELGHFLTKHGYEKGRLRRVKGYWIKS